MKLLLIDSTYYIYNYGLRMLAAYAAANGHDVRIAFLPPMKFDNSVDYPPRVYSELGALLKDSDIAGLSFVSNYMGQAKFITGHIKKNFSIPVIWGGIHSMGYPEDSIRHADMVCFGEGEEALLSLLNDMGAGGRGEGTGNLWVKKDGGIIKNEVLPLEENLDRYPFPFYDSGREYIRDGESIVPLSPEIFKKHMFCSKEYFMLETDDNAQYMTLTSRGCPHSCAYCCNNLFLRLYRGKGKILRRRSVDNIIREFKTALEKFPFVTFISIFDDDFCSAGTDYIVDFASRYKREIKLPFKCNASPNSINEEKIGALVDAGLVAVEMGLQSASERVNRDVYKRKINNDRFLKASRILHERKVRKLHYDVILDNPYETYSETMETIRFLGRLPKPMELSTFSLTFFPGTELYKKAKQDGIITDEKREIFDKKNNSANMDKDPYIKFLILNAGSVRFDTGNSLFSRLLLALLCNRVAVFLLNRPFFNRFARPLMDTALGGAYKIRKMLKLAS